MALNEYEQRIWQEMTSELDEDQLRKVEHDEVEKPYSLRIVLSVILIVLGFAGMMASVAYKNTLTGISMFVIILVASLMFLDAWKYRQARMARTGANPQDILMDILRRLNNS